MEQELAQHLLTLAERYGNLRGLKESTVGRMCAADARFFLRIREGNTFTVKKYDDVLRWFDAQWPEDGIWPITVPRPEGALAETAA